MKKTIILTGGGTAGHIMPNISLLPLIREHFNNIYYIGCSSSMEEKIISEIKDVKFLPIQATKLVRKLTLKNLAIPFKLIKSINQTKKYIKEIKPDVIFCKGGFVSVPVAIAGKSCKIPIVAHESDLSMGLANKIILKFANKMCTTFKETKSKNKKCVCTGTPIRQQIFKGNKNNILSKCNFNKNKPVVLFFGGSLGSKNINTLVEDSIKQLTSKFNILHITGKNNKTKIKEQNYYQTEFANNIEDFFDCADIVVCRGGANSLFELLELKKLMLIIPLSKAQSRGDQIENAEYFKKNNFAEVVLEENLNTANLMLKLTHLINNKDKFNKAQSKHCSDANKKIVDIILNEMKK